MNRSESQFRRDPCERLLKLSDCDDQKLHSQLVLMAKAWVPTSERKKSIRSGRSTLTVAKAAG